MRKHKPTSRRRSLINGEKCVPVCFPGLTDVVARTKIQLSNYDQPNPIANTAGSEGNYCLAAVDSGSTLIIGVSTDTLVGSTIFNTVIINDGNNFIELLLQRP